MSRAERAPIRVLIGKPGLDGHDRGARVIARALRDAGMEVIYTGLFQTPAMIVRAAVDEDVDVVGLSILSGAHLTLLPEIVEGIVAEGREDALIVAGGTIPPDDVQPLLDAGVTRVFGPGTPLADIVEYIREHAPSRTAESV